MAYCQTVPGRDQSDKEGSSLDAKDLGFSGSAGKSKAKSKSKM